ncbi:MAG: hypothetical protein H0T47_06885, partial [Planctomycetaceae bacterium]|nr:hypothetical protein [Planctomycetaceae bacterium]
RREAYDADLQGYFDTIPHGQLLKCLRMRVVDRSVLALIRGWLRAPVLETDDAGGTRLSRSTQGTPQGGVITPPSIASAMFSTFRRSPPANSPCTMAAACA